MILKHSLFEKYEEYIFRIPSERGDRILVHNGEQLKHGTNLIRRNGNNITYSFYIPDQIGCLKENCIKYTQCMDGQFVQKDEILAEKVSSGGLTVKKLVSPISGVIDMSRIANGYIDLLGEEQELILKSTFNGVVESVSPIDGVSVKSSALALDLLAVSQRKDDINFLVGEFVSIGNGKDVILKTPGEDFRDKIVFVGKHLHLGLLRDLFEKGAKFILTYSMDYGDFRNIGLPVGVIGGFGELSSPTEMIERIIQMSGTFAVVDIAQNQTFFLSQEKQKNLNDSLFVQNLVGREVLSHSLGNYGMLGKIIGVEQDGIYITVDWEGKGSSVVNIGSVEFISF